MVKFIAAKKGGCSSLKNVDMFGANVEFTFQGKHRYPTVIGAIMTILIFSLCTAFLIVRTLKLVNYDDPYLSTTTTDAEGIEIDLYALQFYFAVEKPDPRVGRVSVYQTDWLGFGDRSGKTVYDIEMIDCKEYLEGGLYEGFYDGSPKK